MSMSRVLVLLAVTLGASTIYAAPCESVASAGASSVYQRVDALLGEKIVATKLQAVGLSSAQVEARLSRLSERQLGELAAQADMIQVGGTIQGGNVHPLGPLSYLGHQFCRFFGNIYRLLFTWEDIK